MTGNNTGTAIVGGDWPNALPVTVYAEPKPKQTGLDWGKLAPVTDLPVAPPVPKCQNCGATLVNKICRVCTELEEAKRDATFVQARPEPEPEPVATVAESVQEIIEPAPGALWSLPVPTLQFEWAQLLADTADSGNRAVISARFLALAALEHLRITAASATTSIAKPKPKTARPPRPPATRGRGGSKTRANTAEIIRLYAEGNSINEVADSTGHARGTVRTHLLDAGITLRDDRHTKSGSNMRVDPPELTERVRALYEDEHLSQVRIAERLGIGHKVVQGIMRRGGIVAREGQSGSGDTLTGIKDRMAALGVKSGDVRAWAKAHGLVVNVRGVVPADVLTAYEDAHR